MRHFLLLPVAAILVACGGAGDATPESSDLDTGTVAIDEGVVDTGTADPDVAVVDTSAPPTDAGGIGPYPSGPYGTAVGSTLADLTMEGYLDVDPTGLASTGTYATVKLSDVRAKSPRKYALLHVSGFT